MNNTLHEAMMKLLDITGNMSVNVMLKLIKQENLYTKKDGSPLTINQLYARANRYPHLFWVKEGRIGKR